MARAGFLRGRILLAAVALAVLGCDSSSDEAREKKKPAILAEVNGEAVSRKNLFEWMLIGGKSDLPTDLGKEELRAVLEEIVDRRILLQRARELKETIDELKVHQYVEAVALGYASKRLEDVLREEGIDEDRWREGIREMLLVEQLIHREVYSRISASDAEIEAYYRKNRKKFFLPRRWRIRQIVVASQEEAQKLRSQILAGVSFSDLAEKKSIAPERSRGGDMGYFSTGVLPKRIEGVVKSLRRGEVSPVVRTSFGYHLIQVTEWRSAGAMLLEVARERIRKEIVSAKGRKRYREWIAGLRKKATIRYFWGNLNRVAAR